MTEKTKHLDITDKKFGRLTAIKRVSEKGARKTMWLCECKCGNKIEVYITYLTTGETKSCGCLKRDLENKNLREEYDKKKN